MARALFDKYHVIIVYIKINFIITINKRLVRVLLTAYDTMSLLLIFFSMVTLNVRIIVIGDNDTVKSGFRTSHKREIKRIRNYSKTVSNIYAKIPCKKIYW